MEDILGDNSEIPIRFRNWYKESATNIFCPRLLGNNTPSIPAMSSGYLWRVFKAMDERILKPLLLRGNKNKFKDPKVLQTFVSMQESDAKEYIRTKSLNGAAARVKT